MGLKKLSAASLCVLWDIPFNVVVGILQTVILGPLVGILTQEEHAIPLFVS